MLLNSLLAKDLLSDGRRRWWQLDVVVERTCLHHGGVRCVSAKMTARDEICRRQISTCLDGGVARPRNIPATGDDRPSRRAAPPSCPSSVVLAAPMSDSAISILWARGGRCLASWALSAVFCHVLVLATTMAIDIDTTGCPSSFASHIIILLEVRV
jgi:hypothetical protein